MTQPFRHGEKALRGHREELGDVSRGIVTQKSLVSFANLTNKSLILRGHLVVPPLSELRAADVWRTVDLSIQEIELVRELMNDQIASAGQLPGVGEDLVPGQHNRATVNSLPAHDVLVVLGRFTRYSKQ